MRLLMRSLVKIIAPLTCAVSAPAYSTQFSGLHVYGFEVSAFEPCDSHEHWMFRAEGDAKDVISKVIENWRAANPKSWYPPPLYLEGDGTVSICEPVKCDYETDVRKLVATSVRVARLATPEEIARCSD